MARKAVGRRCKPTQLAAGKRARNPWEPKPYKLLEKNGQVITAEKAGEILLIGEEAKRIWRYLYMPLIDCGLATEADVFALLELAESIGEMRETRMQAQAIAEAIQNLRGGTDMGGGAALMDECTANEIAALERSKAALKLDIKWAYERVRDLMSGMGCTPAARSKMVLDDAQTDMFVDAQRMLLEINAENQVPRDE